MENAIRVEEDDPHRCQAVNAYGQCDISATKYDDGTYAKFCPMHGGRERSNREERDMRNYRFIKYQKRINEFADNNKVKSLREEIGILRIVMEETVNKCKDETELMIYSPKITDLTIKIEKLVSSCHRLEQSLGQTLDKTAILNIATRIVNIISSHITDEKLISLIIEDIGLLIKE